MKRIFLSAVIAIVALMTSATVLADSFDEAISSISSIKNTEVTTLAKPMLNSMRMPFSVAYNMEAIKRNMTTMTIVNSEKSLSKIRQTIKDASRKACYTVMLHQKDEDGESTTILARTTKNGSYSRLAFIMDEEDEITFAIIDGSFTEADLKSMFSKRRSGNSLSISIPQTTIDIKADTVGMSPEMKQQYLNQLQQGLENYQKGIEQYKKGMEQYQKAMEQYRIRIKSATQSTNIDKIRLQLKEAGFNLPYTFDNANFDIESYPATIQYHNKGEEKKTIIIDKDGKITINGKVLTSKSENNSH